MSEFVVQKITDRHPEPTKRILCLTEATILERDPQTYSVSAHFVVVLAKTVRNNKFVIIR